MTKQTKTASTSLPATKSSGMENGTESHDRIEFHRNAVALMPKSQDADQGVAVMVLAKKTSLSYRGCSCSEFRSKTCRHIKALSRMLQARSKKPRIASLYDLFKNSVWYHLAQLLWDTDRMPAESIRITDGATDNPQHLEIVDSHNRVLAFYYAAGTAKSRFIDRFANNSGKPYSTRSDVLNRLKLFTLSENERELMRLGMKTRRQNLEDSFWYRMAYHAFQELGPAGFSLDHDFDEMSGRMQLSVATADQTVPFRLMIPKQAVNRLVNDPVVSTLLQKTIDLSSRPVKPVLNIRKDRRGTLRLSPVYVYQSEEGRQHRFTYEQAQKLSFGPLFYIPETGTLAPVSPPDALFKAYGKQPRTTIYKKDVPNFLETYGKLIRNSGCLSDDDLETLQVFNSPGQITLSPGALEKNWCWLSATYRFGNSSLSLSELLKARKNRHRYLSINDGWVDTRSAEMETLFQAIDTPEDVREKTGALRLKRMHLFRMLSVAPDAIEISGKKPAAGLIRQMLTLKPSTPPPQTDPLASPLRAYQKRGVEWLWFLYENGFGGLLCDDMGLGKTHQLMALMLCLKSRQSRPFLVVCPTTIISHWEKKIQQHAPSLKAAVYHGQDRNLTHALGDVHLLITSYGIILRDVHKLADIPFSLVVFDEIQHIKNASTKSFKASRVLTADMKIGLTGTPIENSLWDLKSMMDLVLPEYLGTDASFNRLYAEPIERNSTIPPKQALSRIISPFTLRRLKSSVLTELPEKIEDYCFCTLSEDQVKLYRDAVDSRRTGVLDKLRSPRANIPYIHIFALLTLLKQICNHPAQLEEGPEAYQRLQSGKWDLFTELLSEALESGQKVVIYSQFVKMIRIIELYLSEKKVGHVVLTGQSRRRGDLIEKFNTDPACRVFVGSLRASGSGIDLVAASVVIHYDRWWNAAKEDQATDRVHRIGQHRGVQVFKLVTTGTLEEKISAIIEKKKNLVDKAVKEDDPGILKTFSREDLIELLAPPEFTR